MNKDNNNECFSGYVSQRPAEDLRCFSSVAVEKAISEVTSVISDCEVAWMFGNCYPNTLDTTIDYEIIDGKPDTFVITGDIDAMWLRDSTAQVWPYLQLVDEDDKLKDLIKGLVNRQTKCILHDPYANSFSKDLLTPSIWASDKPAPIPGVHERKWEIDSLCYAVRLAYGYYETTGDASIFDDDWDRAMKSVVSTLRTEQRKNGNSPYYFIRETSAMLDAPVFQGSGRPIKPVGLICSMFRPSDDATMYPFLIPSNLFAVWSLRCLSEIYADVYESEEFSKECSLFADEVDAAVSTYGIFEHPEFGNIYAYEVDGFGNSVFMDDANVPSLMSLAYLGIHKSDDAIYANTRKFLVSEHNPYFQKGAVAEGQGSPHTGKDNIWPMGIILRALTSDDDAEIIRCLSMLKKTHAGTGFMHESFNKDDPSDFTRKWFAWANTLFGELLMKLNRERPHILAQSY